MLIYRCSGCSRLFYIRGKQECILRRYDKSIGELKRIFSTIEHKIHYSWYIVEMMHKKHCNTADVHVVLL